MERPKNEKHIEKITILIKYNIIRFGFKRASRITKPHSVSIVSRIRRILKLRINEGETWGIKNN